MFWSIVLSISSLKKGKYRLANTTVQRDKTEVTKNTTEQRDKTEVSKQLLRWG